MLIFRNRIVKIGSAYADAATRHETVVQINLKNKHFLNII